MSDAIKNNQQSIDEEPSFNIIAIWKEVILNWEWFLLSIIICIGLAFIYLHYSTPKYQAYAKLLIKSENEADSRNSSVLQKFNNLGLVNNTIGIENEIEILKSTSIAEDAVRDLKLYISYYQVGLLKDCIIYHTQPIEAEFSFTNLNKINRPIQLTIEYKDSLFIIEGHYYKPIDELLSNGPFDINLIVNRLPTVIKTDAGNITLKPTTHKLKNGETIRVVINPPHNVAKSYAKRLQVKTTSKNSSVLDMTITDAVPQRAIEYLRQLTICYNRQANEDKNKIAKRTEEFIEERLDIINHELGNTDGAMEQYKRSQQLVEFKTDARETSANAINYEQKLADANIQLALIKDVSYAANHIDLTQLIPTNIGLDDNSINSLIAEYNKVVLERNRILRTAAENSLMVEPLTDQLHDMRQSILQSLAQVRKNTEIQRNAIAAQHKKYTNEISQTPLQERILTNIGRQQEVKSSLYQMLLQKREENSISLASTVDKSQLIEAPQYNGKVGPISGTILFLALLLGIVIPIGILYFLHLIQYRIEDHNDIIALTSIPIIADVPLVNDSAKTKANIVVHENTNNQIEEVFRLMRTNLHFFLKDKEKVLMFTSSVSNEGKTFNAINLAVCFALLDKKVIIIGLDIRKPQLANLFEVNDHRHGITRLLTIVKPTSEEVFHQIIKSGINSNLDLLLAGPVPPNPSELIARPSLATIINILRENYDYIILDTPPIGLVSDALQIARIADATIYICRSNYTTKQSFKHINVLNDEKILPKMSIVLNAIDMSKRKNAMYYGYGNYRWYGLYSYYGDYGNYHTKNKESNSKGLNEKIQS